MSFAWAMDWRISWAYLGDGGGGAEGGGGGELRRQWVVVKERMQQGRVSFLIVEFEDGDGR